VLPIITILVFFKPIDAVKLTNYINKIKKHSSFYEGSLIKNYVGICKFLFKFKFNSHNFYYLHYLKKKINAIIYNFSLT